MADNSPEQQAEAMRKFVEMVENASRELDPQAKALKESAEAAKKNSEELKKLTKQFGTSVVDLSKTLTDAKDSTGKYSGGIEAGAKAIGGITAKLLPFGNVIGGLIGIFGKLVSSSLKQNDAIIKTYRSLAEFGDLDNSNFKKILNDMQSAGFSVNQNSEAYIAAIKKVAPELAALGGSASLGKQKLIDVFKFTLGSTEKQLERFGITSEEAFSRTANYMGQLAISGGARNRTEKELNNSSVKYMETLVALSAITGQTRDDAEKARQEQQNDLRWQMHIAEIRATKGQAAADREQDMLTAIRLRYGKETEEGIKSLRVNQGRIVDDAGARAYQMFGNKGMQNFNRAFESTGDLAKNVGGMFESNLPIVQQKFKQFGGQVKFGNDAMKDFNISLETYAGMNATEAQNTQAVMNQMAKLRKDGANGQMDDNTKRKQAERQIRNAFEQIQYDIAEKAVPAVVGFADIMRKTAKFLAEMIKKLGGKDYTGAFRDNEDVMSDIKSNIKEYKKITEEISAVEKLKKEGVLSEIEADKELSRLRRKQKSYGRTLSNLDLESQKYGGSGLSAGNKSVIQRDTGVNMNSGADPGAGDQNRAGGAGGAAAKLTRVSSASGVSTAVGSEYAPAFQKLIDYLDKSGYKINTLYGYNDRDVAGQPGKKSIHAYGGAIDINPSQNPMGSKLITDMPNDIAAVAASLGLGWGGNWKDKKDAMHFSAAQSEGGSLLGAKTGGIFSGPNSGYTVQLHGKEAVIPLSSLNNLVTKHQLNSGAGSMSSSSTDISGLIEMLATKLDDMVEYARKSANTQDEILTYTKA